jgi:secondary thiamine-phosphate synthase enzyme
MDTNMLLQIKIDTRSRTEMVDITPLVQWEVTQKRVSEGICVVYVPHTTAGITINEGADPDVCTDIITALNALVPPNAGYRHMEGNSDSHIKTSLMGNSVNIIIDRGVLVLGRWQKIFFCEFDGPRSRKAFIKIL